MHLQLRYKHIDQVQKKRQILTHTNRYTLYKQATQLLHLSPSFYHNNNNKNTMNTVLTHFSHFSSIITCHTDMASQELFVFISSPPKRYIRNLQTASIRSDLAFSQISNPFPDIHRNCSRLPHTKLLARSVATNRSIRKRNLCVRMGLPLISFVWRLASRCLWRIGVALRLQRRSKQQTIQICLICLKKKFEKRPHSQTYLKLSLQC